MSASGRGRISKNIAPGKLTMLYWKTTYPKIFGQHRFVLIRERNEHKVGWIGKGWWIWKTLKGA